MKEQDEDEGARRRYRSKMKIWEHDEDGITRRRWRSRAKTKEQDEDEGAILR